MKKVTSQHHFLLIFILLFLTMIAHKAKSLAAEPAALDARNATRISDCVADEEFMVESETSRRLLAPAKKPVTNGALVAIRTFCKRNEYGSCIGEPNTNYKKRPCDYKNHCGNRAPG